MPSEAPNELLNSMRDALDRLPDHDPRFEIGIAFADDYDDLLARQLRDSTSSVSVMLDAANEAGRLMLAAEAGAGKSSVTTRILAHALERGIVAVRVDLRRWTPAVDDAWRLQGRSDHRRMALLLERLADVPVAERTLRWVSRRGGALIVVDGLNEVPPSATRGMLWVLDEFAARAPWAAVVMCDRLQRRPLPSDLWRLATVTSVRLPSAEDSLGPDNALLLDLDPSAARGSFNEARILLDHARADADLRVEELDLVAEACLGLYKEQEGRFFNVASLVEAVGEEIVERLIGGGDLLREGDRAFFRHHLFHDALAARALVADSGRWGWSWFDVLTFRANSFDAVALGLELLDGVEAADGYVMAVYDWNPYAAPYAVSQGRRHGSIAVSPGTELALLAVLAERRWDAVAASARTAEDALRFSPAPVAGELLTAADLEEVVEIVRRQAGGLESVEWLPLFTGEAPAEELITALGGSPLPGWIASNSLRRLLFTDSIRHSVLEALRSSNRTVRWRAAHALGADPSVDSVEALLSILDHDEWRWSRYGAVRALVEIAGRDRNLRGAVVEELGSRITQLAKDSIVFGELQRALELRDPPDGWASAVGPLIEELFRRATTVDDQDHWRRVGWRLTQSVRAARGAEVT